jgi:hypothetical protein
MKDVMGFFGAFGSFFALAAFLGELLVFGGV